MAERCVRRGSGGASLRKGVLGAAILICGSPWLLGQSFSSNATDTQPAPDSSAPNAPQSAPSNASSTDAPSDPGRSFHRGDVSPDSPGPHADGAGPGGPRHGEVHGGESNSVDWSRFFSNMLQSTARAALPRAGAGGGGSFGSAPNLSQDSGGGMGAENAGGSGMGSFQSGGFSSNQAGGGQMGGGQMSGGMGGGPGGGGMGGGAGMGRMNMFSLGNNVMRSFAASTSGPLGESFNMLARGSSLNGPGMSTSMKTGGLNLNLSGSVQGLWGGSGGGNGGGQGGDGQSMFSDNSSGGFGQGGGHGGPGGGHGGGPGLGLALHMKF
ncbi:hypothetical protein [Silvibacterium sp.]|uniref:hypothetical protein n=1 Tax=Silvibacterium sp. TaxID=1964179 RepID=UPI0039E29B68